MYRDLSTDLDERDRAVGAILMGEALVDGCERAVARAGGESTPPPERWRAIAHVHDAYLDIWRHLDQARRVLADRGANTMAYDELRPNVRRAATNPGLDGERAVDCDALEDARRAIGELKLAVPGADWDAIDARTQGLVNAPLGHRAKHRLALAAGLAALAIAVTTWASAIAPRHKPDPRVVMRGELAQVVQARKLRIEILNIEIAGRCLTAPSEELVRLLVLDGRSADARHFADAYIWHCGGDDVIARWGAAPKPGL